MRRIARRLGYATGLAGAVIVLAVLLNAVQYRKRAKTPNPAPGGAPPLSPQKAV
jgi:erythritol transport system permease protein